MPAFDKNSVQIDHAYVINPIEEEEIQLQACPRCGAMAERKHRTVCLSCKRHIPPTVARQKWDAKGLGNAFADLSPLVVRERQIKEHRFGLVKKDYWAMVRGLRQAVVVMASATAVYFAAPHIGILLLGKATMQAMNQEMAYVLGVLPSKDVTGGLKQSH